MRFPSVQEINQWVLSNAFSFAVVVALAFALHVHVGVELTAAKERALERWMLWCAALQAAATGPALLLPGCGRRSRLLVAYVALAATAANHSMYAWFAGLALAADPAYLSLWVVSTVAVIFFAVGDVLGLALLLGQDE